MEKWAVQLASNFNDHPISQGTWFTLTQKLNGIRGTFYRGRILGRNGTSYAGLEHISKALTPYSDFVFDGELVLANPGDLTDSEAFRAASGLVRRQRGDKSNLSLVIFDVIPVVEFEQGRSQKTYRTRRAFLDQLADEIAGNPAVRVLPTLYQGQDISVIPSFLRQMIDAGKEGLIANLDTEYRCRRNSGILKIKQFHTMDLPILRCEEGTGKFAGTLGSFIVDFNGSEVGVGVGFTKEQRDAYWESRDTLPGMLCEVKYKEVSRNERGGKSLQFPVFLSLRTDKTEVSYGPDAPETIFDLLTEVSSHPEQQAASAPANPASETTALSDFDSNSASENAENTEPVTSQPVARNMPSYTIQDLTRILLRTIPEVHMVFQMQTNHPYWNWKAVQSGQEVIKNKPPPIARMAAVEGR